MDLNLMRDLEVPLHGKRHRLAKISAGMIEAMQDWYRPQLEAQIVMMERLTPHLSQEVKDKLALAALEDTRQLEGLSFESPLGQKMIKTSKGFAKLTHLRMLANDPNATEDDAMEIVLTVGKEEMERAARAAASKPKKAAEEPDPNPPSPEPSGDGDTSIGSISSGG